METEKGNNFFEGGRKDEDRNYNRFSREDNQSGEGRPARPRFVKVDYGTRQQYSRQGGQDRRGGYSNDRRSNYSGDRRSSYQGEGRQGNQEGRQGGYGQENRQYGQQQRRPYNSQSRYNGGNGGYQSNRYGAQEQSSQPRFYRERVQEEGMHQEGGYQQRQYRPRYDVQDRQQDGGYRQGGYRQGGYRQGGGYGQNGYGQGRPSYGAPRGGARPMRRPDNRKHIEYHDVIHDPDESIRLNKYLANAGVCSRREADDFILAGVVKVNGETVTELGTKVKRGDNVLFHGELVNIEKKIYILLNKPKDCVTTVDDPQERKTVMDYIKGACKERVYPVGRLDRNTTGVLLLTNDGEMATRLTHPKFLKKKIYHARLDRNVSPEDLQKLLDGVCIGEDPIMDTVRADEVSYVNEDRSQVGIEIHSGRNRVVRRMFDALGYRVAKLDRVQFAGLTKKRLRRGDWRFLTEKEVNMLRMGAFE